MKKILLSLIAFSTLFSTPVENRERIGLLSYPRVGSRWFMYALIFGANRSWRVNHSSKNTDAVLWHNFEQEVDESKVVLDTSHHRLFFEKEYLRERDKLILILRNYRECLIRHSGVEKVLQMIHELNTKSGGKFSANWYLKNLQFFDDWPEERRLLIYYEDMIQNPKEVFERVATFIDEDPEVFASFLAHYKEHVAKSLAWRNAKEGHVRAQSMGRDLSYHSKRISRKKRQKFDEAVKNNYPDLWEKYLTRYESK
ncbi:MAG: sulfotransferase domain-containing protein [Candidatus Algichlamydia australiensis]|nr:sulfotransferase domain-containing protein [Chlamydiales bacterium]